MRCSFAGVVLLLSQLFGPSAQANTWYILPDGTGDAPTIQSGIYAALEGDTVLLADAVFTGTGNWNLDFLGKAITVRSESGNPANCTIDLGGLYAHRGFQFITSESPASRVEGITIADGFHSHGAGVWIETAFPTIVDCVFLRCVSQSDGGAVHCTNNASPVFQGCRFIDNRAYFTGGAIRLGLGSGVQLIDCLLQGNSAVNGGGIYSFGSIAALSTTTLTGNEADEDGGGLYLDGSDGSTITDCIFRSNVAGTGSGGGAHCVNSSPSFSGCTFYGNEGSPGGGMHCRISSSPTIDNTIITSSVTGCAVFCSGSGDQALLSCSNLFDNPGGDWIDFLAGQYGVDGNISLDPLFCDVSAGEFTLHSDSPCADGNHPGGDVCGTIGALDAGCGSTTATEEASWGKIKEMFR